MKPEEEDWSAMGPHVLSTPAKGEVSIQFQNRNLYLKLDPVPVAIGFKCPEDLKDWSDKTKSPKPQFLLIPLSQECAQVIAGSKGEHDAEESSFSLL